MQIIITIDDKDYNDIMTDSLRNLNHYERLIKNGTPLPKGHGRLGDLDAICKDVIETLGIKNETFLLEAEEAVYKRIKNADTIIEKDKEYEAKVITRGNCMMCGKELTEGLFFCKECEAKAAEGRKLG